MFQVPHEDFRLHVGWRTIKTAVTAMLVAVWEKVKGLFRPLEHF